MPQNKNYITKEELIEALEATQSVRMASRYLGISYHTIRKWCKLYKDKKSGLNLLEKYKNPTAKGIAKYYGSTLVLDDILNGKIDASYFPPEKIRERLIIEGYLFNKCYKCGFDDERVLDGKVPLLFNFKDGNRKNFNLKNIELLCYNCYFLNIGNIFSVKEILSLENYNIPKKENENNKLWQLDPYHAQRLKDLGLEEDDETKDYIDSI